MSFFLLSFSFLLFSSAYMNLGEEHLQSYFSKHPKIYLGGWKNLAPARTLAVMSFYNPISDVPDIRIPILFIAASNDTLCPASIVAKAASKAMHVSSRLVTIDASHFDMYNGDNAKLAVNHMISFLNLHLK
jgi:pimeloyl-ACP methyl ester carboxylesterase